MDGRRRVEIVAIRCKANVYRSNKPQTFTAVTSHNKERGCIFQKNGERLAVKKRVENTRIYLFHATTKAISTEKHAKIG